MPYAFVGWIATAGAEGLLAARAYKVRNVNVCRCKLCTTNDWRELTSEGSFAADAAESFAYELGYN